jgi:hypothetical protein
MQRPYIYLDTEADRMQVMTELARIRVSVLNVIEIVPETEWYTPRYHGWSLAAMLGHLNTVDNLAMLQIQAALLNIRLAIPLGLVNWSNGWMARLYQRRLIAASRRGIVKNEKRIADFIRYLPVDKFSKAVYYPPFEHYTTVERALQDYFIFHWQEHLQTMLRVEGIQQPPE